jgi:hypothetical protein
MKTLSLLPIAALGLVLTLGAAPARAELRVPASTAYLEPDPDGARVSERSGISGWTDPANKVLWFGEFKNSGKLECSIALRLPAGKESRLRLTLAGTSREAVVKGSETNPVIVPFGSFDLAATGYQRFTLESLNPSHQSAGDVQALILDGPAVADAHFNLKSRRNAASVHLAYPTSQGEKIEAFYCEVTAVEDPLWTYYMACGWHRGYFGMQVNSPTERRIIFSVWDSGNEAVDRSKVDPTNRVTLVAKGEGVDAGDFGNEGTGGHSHLVYPWKTGEKQRFLVTAKPTDATHTIYSGYFYHPEQKRWVLISSWKAPRDGGYLRGLYSFSENFGGSNGELRRKALYGNQWIRTLGGEWTEQTVATFSHDPTGRADRLDRFMGVENGQFFLSQGGFIPGFTKFGEKFTRPSGGQAPKDFTPTTATMGSRITSSVSAGIGTMSRPEEPEESSEQPSPEKMAKSAGVTLPHQPWHLVNIWWEFQKPVEHFETLEMTLTIDRDIPSTFNLYVSPCGLAKINGMDFYGGLQSNINGWQNATNHDRIFPGHGAIFSRWSEDKKTPVGLDHVRTSGSDCLVESAGYEGEFASVRRPFAWTKGTYTYRIEKGATEIVDGKTNTWFTCRVKSADGSIRDIGSLRFEGSDFTYWAKHSAFVEVYSTSKVPHSNIPKVNITFSLPRLNGQAPEMKRVHAYYPSQTGPASPDCAWVKADGQNARVEVGPIFKRDEKQRRHDVVLTHG